jgi:hypothetical protein
MGCRFSDEAIVVIKRYAEDDAGDPSEEKTYRKRHGAKGEGRNMLSDKVDQNSDEQRSGKKNNLEMETGRNPQAWTEDQ